MKLKKQNNSDLKINSLIFQSYSVEISVIYLNQNYHVYPMYNTLTLYKR